MPTPSENLESSEDDHAAGAGRAGSLDFVREKVQADIASGKYDGVVQTRFPPEPNGFLHIGHAKSIYLNFGIAEEYNGTCYLRFDDTNPETEDESFVDAIREDLRWLGVTPAGEPRFASDYFEQLYAWAEELIVKRLAYVDDQDKETISAQRGGFGQPGVDSPFRNRSVEENLELFRGMRDGIYDEGARVLRAKIDMQADNMWLRDPVLYRIRKVPHHRTGDRWSIYPTYDWAHGQSDAIEGTTHSICTLEFADHRALYDWCLDQIDLPKWRPEQTEFARLNLTHTVLSKRTLKALVEDGVVEGWDDARMPTVRGLRRRGYPAEAIRAFTDHISVAKTNSVVEIELLESFVRTHHNARALRRMAVVEPLKLTITNWPDGRVEWMDVVNNPEDPTAGTRSVPFTGELFIEQDDFKLDPPPKYFRLTPGREVRLRNAFLITATEAITDAEGNVTEVLATYDPETRGGNAPDGRKVKSTMHWVSRPHALAVTVHRYERLFAAAHPGSATGDPMDDLEPNSRLTTVAQVEPALGEVEPGQVVQFERLGYFAADLDDATVFHRTVGLKDEWANIQKQKK
ncbi:MAG: glutamine--tRNA ligase/YqeY domain fusion protein [Actinobacteria bacterium]|nr:glutamine--tRNA ligase/YqeY domain fusion protein [Actinomycetota bacterium]